MKKTLITTFLISSIFTLMAQRIAVLSDVHVVPGNANEVYLLQAVDEINAGDYDIVVMNGDLTNEGADTELILVKSILDKIRHPLYVIPGNHENNWSQSATKTFIDLWGNDRFVCNAADKVVIGLNCGPYMKMGDGHVKQEDLHWLKSSLDSLTADGRQVISFNHYPIRQDDMDNYREYTALLSRYPVILHINGHYHRWDAYKAGDIDAVTVRALTVDDTHGYSLLEITGDSIYVSEKLLGEEPVIKYRFGINDTHPVDNTYAISDIIHNPDGYVIQKAHVDSASIFTRLTVDNERVYFSNSLGEVKALDKTANNIIWRKRIGNGASIFSRAVSLGDGKISVPHPTGISVLDGNNGDLLFEYPTIEGPYVADGLSVSDTIYIQGAYKRVERRDMCDGHTIWTYDSINNYCQAAPVIDGDDLIFGAWDTYLRCLDINTGDEKWRWNNGRTVNLLGPGNVVPAVTDSHIIIVAPDRNMTCIDRATGTTLWRNGSHKFRESMGQSCDKHTVYAKTMDGELVAVNADAAEYYELWLCDLGIGYDHAPCPITESNGVIYVGSRRGLLTAVSADTHEVLWQVSLGSSEINGIEKDPSDDSVWVSLVEGIIYRIMPNASERS